MKAISIILFIFSISIGYSQNGIIKGVIKDRETSQNIPFVSIKNDLGYNIGMSDLDGNFKLNLPIGENKLTLSCMGYQTDSVIVLVKSEGNDILNLTLIEKPVIIIGTRDQEDINGGVDFIRTGSSVISVTGETDIQNNGSVNGSEVVSKITGI